MLMNLLRGDIKLVGVRPLSNQYFELYTEELRAKRIRTKPGLIPPFYADMPKTLDEIQSSEDRYLEAHFRRPFRTDWKYFWKAAYNIVVKKARSN
jgi:lipopolysaccharide/colanic/teichoic acid biosynthesis glycosyltransferase